MTLKTVLDVVAAYVAENRYKLAELRIEVDCRLIGDGAIIRAASFPGVPTAGSDSASQIVNLGMLHAHKDVRDPDKGLPVLIVQLIGDLIATVMEGRHALAAVDSDLIWAYAYEEAVRLEALARKDELARLGMAFFPCVIHEDLGRVDFGVVDTTIPPPNLATRSILVADCAGLDLVAAARSHFQELIDDHMDERKERSDALQGREEGQGVQGDEPQPSAGLLEEAADCA